MPQARLPATKVPGLRRNFLWPIKLVELLVKERLTGAIILVALIVLLVPELLSGPKGPAASAPAGAAAAPSEEPPLRSYTINLSDDSHSQTESPGSVAAGNGPAMPQPSGPEPPAAQVSAPQSTTAEETVGSAAEPSAPLPKPAVAPKPSSATSSAAAHVAASKPARTATAEKAAKGRSAAANTTGSSSAPGAWGVQLGVFASRENAERLALEVRVKGFKASVSPVSGGTRKLYRVRVGPAPDRSAAQELQGRLKAAGRPGGTIVPYS
jgi:DedD protein